MSLYLEQPASNHGPAVWASDDPTVCASCGDTLDAVDEGYWLEDGETHLCSKNENWRPCYLPCIFCEDPVHKTKWYPGGAPAKFHADAERNEKGEWMHQSCRLDHEKCLKLGL